MKRVLMIAYHFPPVHVSSGVHRSLYFTRHLPKYGWHPLVLTVNPRAYLRSEKSLLSKIPPDVPVVRSFALDAKRHLSIKGRYLGLTAFPDRWQSWWFSGVISGLRLIRRYRPEVLWSTFPIATANLIGLTLHKLTRLPWIADFRDPMDQANDSIEPKLRRVYRKLEQKTVKNASAIVFTTPRTAKAYSSKYPEETGNKWRTIENGYDDEIFDEIENKSAYRDTAGPATLVHSGLLYPRDRNPIPFFDALHRLSIEKKISPENLRVVLRASGSEDFYREEIRRRNLESIVILESPLVYKEALEEMISASGLLLFQGSNFNNQIPAKTYEYIRTCRPILAMTDLQGETANLLQRAKCNAILVPMNDSSAIASAISEFMNLIAQPPQRADMHQWSRAAGCAELSLILNEVAGG